MYLSNDTLMYLSSCSVVHRALPLLLSILVRDSLCCSVKGVVHSFVQGFQFLGNFSHGIAFNLNGTTLSFTELKFTHTASRYIAGFCVHGQIFSPVQHRWLFIARAICPLIRISVAGLRWLSGLPMSTMTRTGKAAQSQSVKGIMLSTNT